MELNREDNFFQFSSNQLIESIITLFYDRVNDILDSLKEFVEDDSFELHANKKISKHDITKVFIQIEFIGPP